MTSDGKAPMYTSRPCKVCRHIHPIGTPHPRKQPSWVAKEGAARARKALREALAKNQDKQEDQ